MTEARHSTDEMTFVALSFWSGRDTTAATLIMACLPAEPAPGNG